MPDSDALATLHETSGKVREMYGFGDQLLMVASDRISAFDVVLPTPIPDKGRVLTALSLFWFDHAATIAPNHLITAESPGVPGPGARKRRPGRPLDAGPRLTMLPIECVVRGYLAGSGWKDYQATGAVCGHRPAAGAAARRRSCRSRSSRPRRRRPSGHDENITAGEARELCRRRALRPTCGASRSRSTGTRPSTRGDAWHHRRRHQVRVRPRPGRRGSCLATRC